MRPVRLEFKGLRSYRQTTVIDFTDLDLFAIIGDTGAGKSTVIEALSLALYGRKTWTGGSNLEDLIADGENTMAIELVFLADGNEWTVTRTRHRNSSAPVNKLECTGGDGPALGEKVDGNRPVNERIEALLGLDHSQFVRAVVLPQGRFDELLQATRTDRNKILRSIFGLDDLRRVRDEATRRRDTWQPVVIEAQARRNVLDPNPAGALAVARSTAAAAAERASVLAEAAAQVGEHQARLGRLQQRTSVLAASARALDLDQSAVTSLASLVSVGTELIAERVALLDRQSEAETARVDALDAQAQQLQGFPDAAGAASAASRLRSVATNLYELERDALDAEAHLAQLIGRAPTAEEPVELIDAQGAAQADVDRESGAASVALGLADRASSVWATMVAANADVAAARLRQDGAQFAADDARSNAAVAAVAVTSALAAIETARQANQVALRADAALVAAQGLAPGDPCPVCAQTLAGGFQPPPAADLDAAAAAVVDAETALTDARRTATSADTTASLRNEALAESRRVLDDALVAVGECRAAAIALGIDPAAPSEAEALGALHDAAATAEASLAAAEQRLAFARSAREEAALVRAAAIAAHRIESAAAQQVVEGLTNRRASQRAQIGDLPDHWLGDSADPNRPPEDEPTPERLGRIADAIDTMLASLDTLAASAAAADAELSRVRQRFGELRAEALESVNGPAVAVAQSINAQLAAGRSVAEALAELSDEQPLPLPDPLPTTVVLDQVADLVPLADAALVALAPLGERAAAALASAALETASIDAARQQMLSTAQVADLAALQSEAGAARALAQRAEADIAQIETQVASAARLDVLLSTGKPYLANLELLILSLRDQHFVDHLVSAREVELLAEATRRLKAISDGRYGFVPDFGVVRIASGEVRSPDTLSGGERFQAALALALALVEIASRGAGKLDAVFVDEGFGSLDAAALDVALDTLGSVAGGGKLVALISHLHPVAEYVDTVLSVTKDDLFGSTITKLDAEAREQLLADDVRSGLTT